MLTRTGYVEAIFSTYNVKNEEQKRAYELGLTVNKTIDWQALYEYTIREYDKLPSLKSILGNLDYFRLRPNCEQEGEVIVMITPDNRVYDFIVTGYGSSLLEVKNRLKEQYGGVIIHQFPKGSTVLKNRVLIPNPDNTFTTQALEYKEIA